MSPNAKKHRATDPAVPAASLDHAAGGAHRASRLPDLLIATGLGAVLVVLVWVLVSRG